MDKTPKQQDVTDLYKENQRNTNNRLVRLTVVLAIAATLGFFISAWQAKIAGDVAETARESLVDVQRAFVTATIETSQTNDPFGPAPISADLKIKWENAGTTPTVAMTARDNWSVGDNMPDISQDLGSSPNYPLVLAPRSALYSKPVRVSFADMERFWTEHKHLYMWGWARYRDVFRSGDQHITRYCYDVILSPLPNSKGKNTGWSVIPNSCPTGNCTDGGCQGMP